MGRILIVIIILFVACNNSGTPAAPGKAAENPAPQGKKAAPAAIQKEEPTVPAAELSEEDRNYITQQEDSRFYFDAGYQFKNLGAAYLEARYGRKVPDAETLHQLMRNELIEQRKKSGFRVTRPYIPEEWARPESRTIQSDLADLVYVYGDIDNLGYGWPRNYDPFSGESTNRHDYPFFPERDDPPGTDRIMVNSGYHYPSKENQYKRERADGYTTSTRRPDNLPETLRLKPQVGGMTIRKAILQVFVDDFQAPSYHSQFSCYINGREATFISAILNDLRQGGPVGKLISIQLLPEYFSDLQSEELQIFIDSPHSEQGDGFAIDFVRLLINPRSLPVSTISGKVTDAKTRKPIAGAWIRVSGSKEIQTDAEGAYRLEDIPCGMVVVQAAHAGYKAGSQTTDLLQAKKSVVNISLEQENEDNLQKQLDEKGRIELYGIYFDTDKATIKPASLPTLQQLLALIRKNPEQQLEIGGHTDAEGNDQYNMTLSQQRAEAVLAWLKENKAPVSQLQTRGYGETQPVADNSTETGRALNRRVEIKQLNK